MQALLDFLAYAAGVATDPLVLALAVLAALAGRWWISALAGGGIAWAALAMHVAPAAPAIAGSEAAALVACWLFLGLKAWRASRPRT